MINLDVSWVKNINCFQELPSTQDLALQLAKEGAEEGTLVVSEAQNSGRGRRGNSWFSPKGGLWFSFVLRPAAGIEGSVAAFNLGIGLSVIRAVKKIAGIGALIKWPNDILCGGKKLGGIIADAGTGKEGPAYVVAGIGINTNVPADAFPPQIRDTAVSLQGLGRSVDNLELMGRILEETGRMYRVFTRDGFSPILAEVKKSCYTIGKKIRVFGAGNYGTVTGRAVDISRKGGLVLKTDAGEVIEIFLGNVEMI